MISKPPKVSIGLAIFNGETYLNAALDSILAQTFTDFEVIISDNASSDRTEEICRTYAAKDPRIRYYRNSVNIGGVHNENLTFQFAQGDYFRLAAHDDLLAPQLLEECVNVLDQNPDVVLCYSTTVMIDANGDRLNTIDQSLARSPCAKERFCDVASSQHACEASYSVIRSAALSKTELQPNYPESDFGFLCELSLQGQFYQIPKPLFYRRTHDHQASGSWHRLNPISIDFIAAIQLFFSVVIVFLRQAFHYFRIIRRSSLPFYEKVECWFHALRFISHRLLITRRNIRERFFLTKESFAMLKIRFSEVFKTSSS
jgi:glycosyltransferase involved in cell wall biosynthesis